jgi:hypothetical protein
MMMFQRIKNSILATMNSTQNNDQMMKQLLTVQNTLNELKILEGKKLAIQNFDRLEIILKDLTKAEFKVFSQWGDDGIIQFLVDYLAIENKVFIEFGVENYEESNTRFLLLNNCWKGLILDGSDTNIEYIKKSNLYWQYQLEAKCCFITKENIDTIIANYTNIQDIGLLVIDIDGNDYWVWEAIESVKPIIVVVEYNSLFGCKRALTIPYQNNFTRTSAHFSHLYYGASLKALQQLGNRKGYALVTTNKNGNNAYFIRKDKMKQLIEIDVEKAYRQSSFRESRNQQHQLNYLNFDEAVKAIQGLPVFDVESGLSAILQN